MLISGEINKDEFNIISKYGIPAAAPAVWFNGDRPTIDLNQFKNAEVAYSKIGEPFQIRKCINVSKKYQMDKHGTPTLIVH